MRDAIAQTTEAKTDIRVAREMLDNGARFHMTNEIEQAIGMFERAIERLQTLVSNLRASNHSNSQ